MLTPATAAVLLGCEFGLLATAGGSCEAAVSPLQPGLEENIAAELSDRFGSCSPGAHSNSGKRIS